MKNAVIIAIVMTLAMMGWNVQSRAEEFTKVDTGKVVAALKDPNWVVVDTRLNDAFNGWKLDGITRGGHINGAVDFSANWLKVEEKNLKEPLQEILATKGITPDKQIVLYDANGKDADNVAKFLHSLNYPHLFTYDVKQWAADTDLPMTKYENYHLIVPAVVVKEILDGKYPETFKQDKPIKLIEASWGEEKTSYAKGHIPTTFHINTDRVEPPTPTEPPMWILADDATLGKLALEIGVTKNDTVIVTSEEPLAAYRVATVLRYTGVDDVRVLNGGTLAWTMAGYELETERHNPVPVKDFGGPVPGHPEVIDTMAETKAGLAEPDRFILVDNRTWQEHIGEISGYSYHDKKGRIPGAIFGYAGKKDSYGMEYFRNPDKTMRNAEEFLALWREQGIDTSKHLSFMCGSGWRVAEIYTYADVYGLDDIGIFSDGWIGWSTDPANPIVTGVPKKN
ncbi:rhodanese-like domain-containing protein [Desulfopila aestuarii]|uniref:Thiosulfate/3-mercaptopyruvate sulfurtransferase n=1 Tax=Desulfopila aestuarii DSM 18488 TaxID=1121416 RepID=A0A1M7YB62_9BACT|nr:rhodanese-like domain-containing protein [Desulfopila aestuarii]SHO49884.1 thiosulfate/3-mercaptopyruvate sulfurtransferase [Desulfopila aestuarii DSM 18488]